MVFIIYDTFWAGSPDRFGGPYSSRKEAKDALRVAEEEEEEFVWAGESPRNIRDAFRILGIFTQNEVFRGFRPEFSKFFRQWEQARNEWLEGLLLDFVPGKISHKGLRKIMARS